MSLLSVATTSRRGFLVSMTSMGMMGALAAAGCTSSPAPSATSAPSATKSASQSAPAQAPAQSKGPVTITFSTQASKTEAKMFDAIVQAFEQSQDQVKIDKKYDPTLSWPKIINMIRTGVAADVQRTDDDSVWVITAAGVVTILDDYFRGDLKRDDYYPLMFERRVGPGGELGAAYVATDPIVCYFNTDLMKKHEIAIPTSWTKDNWDVEKFEANLATLTEKSGARTNVYAWNAPDWWIPNGLYDNGINFFNKDQTQTDFATPPGVEIFAKWQSWFAKGYAVPPGENPTQLFNSGLLAMKYDYSQFGYTVKQGLNVEIGPTWKGKVRTTATHAGRCFAIPKTSKLKDEAWQFMKWLWTQSPDGKKGGQAEFARWSWGVPMLKAAAEGPVFKENKPYKNLNVMIEAMSVGAPPWPQNPISESFMIPWRRMGSLDTSKITPEDYAKNECDKFYNRILADTGWNASLNHPGYTLEGVIQKTGSEK